MDWIPGVSQVKSTFQLVCGDVDGAARTQENFFRECPGVSQITSTLQLVAGDPEGALETQKRCGGNLMRVANGIPVVGHAKGVIHYACGDTEGGNQAMKSATRTVGVIGGGAGGFLAGGPVGAVWGGIAGGVAMDGLTTGIESAARDEYCPSGYIAAVTNIVEDPTPGGLFDLVMMPVADGLAGYGTGKAVPQIKKFAAENVKPKAVALAKGTKDLLLSVSLSRETVFNIIEQSYKLAIKKAVAGVRDYLLKAYKAFIEHYNQNKDYYETKFGEYVQLGIKALSNYFLQQAIAHVQKM